MSRIGKRPIPLPEGVKVTLQGLTIAVKGPKGKLSREVHPSMSIDVGEKEINVKRPSDQPTHRALHGLTRTLIANMVAGVTQGFEKVLELEGVGYRAEVQGKALVLQVGYSHPVRFQPPEGITLSVDKPFSRPGGGRHQVTPIIVSGINKETVGQIAAEIRSLRKPEPYKGKGIRYRGEYIRRKAGKSGVKAAVAT